MKRQVWFPPLISVISVVMILATPAHAAACGTTATGFQDWKNSFATTAKRAGVGKKGLQALAGAKYASQTIKADRNQKSFRYTLDKFLQIRGADTIVAQGRKRKAKDAAYFTSLEQKYGVPAGILLAIHGMETGFGHFMGDSNVVDAIVTLTYDCRRSDFFRPHALAALKLVDQGTLSANTIGARHGEVGHTQFLPGSILDYAVDGTGDGRIDLTNSRDALSSTANYLREKGWRSGKGYQEGQPNYKVIQTWNAATVYQQAIALMAARIDR